MTTIIDKLAQREGIDHLPAIDPNTQNVLQTTDKLVQATIPAVLAGFYKFTRNEPNAAKITSKSALTDWIEILFGDDSKKLIRKIASYGEVSLKVAEIKMRETVDNTVNILKEDFANQDGKAIKKYFTYQRNAILNHLPAAIEIGNILNDTTLDDRTNKMDGPISSLMHTIEKTFAATDTGELKK
ncbi:MAG: hypothetical protein QM764_11680 [Chitinophagaceae bacterium]